MMQEPANPPKMALKSKALEKIMPNMCPRFGMLMASTISATRTYMTPITGTRTSVTLISRFAPPRTTMPKRTASTMPMTAGVEFSL